FADGRYGLDPAELARRDSATRRAFFMLVSETIFVILVCSYGTLRVMRTILRERRLGHERQIFIDSVTHELKTPLASILLNLQTILKRDPPKAGRDELIQDSIDDVRRLEEQLNNILLSGRLGRRSANEGGPAKDDARQNALAANTEAVNAIRNFFQENAKRFEQAGLASRLDLPEHLHLRIDLDSFRTILSNLLQNTIQYAGSGRPEIQISAKSKNDREALLIFKDAGPGIPATERENVFQPFYRLNEGQRPVRGSGMGLYLARELARNAGGDVRVAPSDQKEGGAGARSGTPGATIEVRLPLAPMK
ncbi:MAG: HAMP domain-containing sensor histidine kinase, partial [Leptospirales bacterium]